jgi:hypothetical protein
MRGYGEPDRFAPQMILEPGREMLDKRDKVLAPVAESMRNKRSKRIKPQPRLRGCAIARLKAL